MVKKTSASSLLALVISAVSRICTSSCETGWRGIEEWFLDVMNLHVVDVVVVVDGVSVLHRDWIWDWRPPHFLMYSQLQVFHYSSYVRWWKYLLNRKWDFPTLATTFPPWTLHMHIYVVWIVNLPLCLISCGRQNFSNIFDMMYVCIPNLKMNNSKVIFPERNGVWPIEEPVCWAWNVNEWRGDVLTQSVFPMCRYRAIWVTKKQTNRM